MSKTLLRHTLIKNIFDILWTSLSLYIFTIWKTIVYYRLEEDISSIQINKEEGWCVVEFTKNQGKKIYNKCLLFGLYLALLNFIVLQFSTEKQATGPELWKDSPYSIS
jgi:hypothetical protein